jgi:hypothetical protein
MEANHQDFHRQWHRFKHHIETILYENRRYRLQMTPHNKVEVKFRVHAKKWIMDAAPDGVIHSDTLTELLQVKATRLKLSKALDAVEEQPVAVFTNGGAEKMIYQLFDVEEETFHGFKEYRFSENKMPPFCRTAAPSILNKPLEFLKIYF